jgi:hypothetical protein
MSTGYVVFERCRSPETKQRIIRVFWREADAVELVVRLNALTKDPALSDFYAWQPVWIERREAREPTALTPHDREFLELAGQHGALGTERPIAVFFTFLFNLPGALATCEELRALGWPEVGADEELTGDECWHVYAHQRRLEVNAESILQLRAAMEALAERFGGTFDRWDVSGGGGLRHSEPGTLPK